MGDDGGEPGEAEGDKSPQKTKSQGSQSTPDQSLFKVRVIEGAGKFRVA